MLRQNISWNQSPYKKLSFVGEHPQCCVALHAVKETLVLTAGFPFPSV